MNALQKTNDERKENSHGTLMKREFIIYDKLAK